MMYASSPETTEELVRQAKLLVPVEAKKTDRLSLSSMPSTAQMVHNGGQIASMPE